MLVKHENIFRRAKVLDYGEADLVIVFFMDIGLTHEVPRKSIYQWHPMWSLVPGTVCHLSRIKEIWKVDAKNR